VLGFIINELINEINNKMEKNDEGDSLYTVNTESKPNIVFLQLESFVDTSYLLNLEYSINSTHIFNITKIDYFIYKCYNLCRKIYKNS
jgi:hypothetical protein